MQFKITVSVLALVASISALQIQYPAEGSNLDFSKKNVIRWTSVNTDPTSFDIYLVDMTVNPSYSKIIASNVQTSAGHYDIDSLNVPAGQGYQINFDADSAQNQGILAQSGQFNIVEAGSSSTSSASFVGTTGSASTTSTGSSSGTSASTGSGSASTQPSISGSATGSLSSATRTSSGSNTASGANASSTGNAASKMVVSSGVTGLMLGVLALLM